MQEALHVFVEAGLNFKQKEQVLSVLEVGFGTGLNALLTARYARQQNKTIHYTGVELHPVDLAIISKLNYLEGFKNENLVPIFKAIHESEWEKSCFVTDNFNLIKRQTKIQEVNLQNNTFDLVFYDAFGPRAQIEMWDKMIFEKLYKTLKIGGVLVTYCAMGQLKRDLKAVGFTVQSIPGPPGKREMIRAIKV